MLNKIRQSSIKTKLILSILLISVFCILITLIIAYGSFKSALTKSANDQLSSTLAISKRKVGDYYSRTKTFTELLATDRLTEGLFLSYESAFYAAGYSVGKDQVITAESFKKLDEIYKNKALVRVSSYDIGNFILVNITGQVLFSAKGVEHGFFEGRSLVSGDLSKTKLAKCVNSAKESNSKNIFYAEYEFIPEFKREMAFFCVNVFAEFVHLSEGINKGDLLGVVAVEIDPKHITDFLSAGDGTGIGGQTYLVDNEEKTKASPDALRASIPVDIEGKSWNLVSEKKTSEVFAPIKELLKQVFFYSSVVLISIAFAGVYLSNKLLAPIIKASITLGEVCKSLNLDSNHLSQSASILDGSSRDQAANLQKTVQAVHEISSAIEQNTSNAKNSESLAKKSLEVAINGREVVESMTQSMSEINQGNQDILNQVEESNKQINEILVLISEIGNKTELINDIVFQTKLLSFNASVEAARAGENGKGFAVVAEEVGNLAQSSGNSAKEISALLSESINKVESIIHDTNLKVGQVSTIGRDRLKAGQETVQRCTEVFDEMVRSFNQVASMVSEISQASNEQNTGMGEINQAMLHLNEGTDKTTLIASESSEAASKLESRAKTLEEVVQNIQQVIHGV